LGAGLADRPDYPDSSHYQVRPVPLIAIGYGEARLEINPRDGDEFFEQIRKSRINFEHDAMGRVTALELRRGVRAATASRLDAERAAEHDTEMATLRGRIQSQAADPRSEAALRRLIAGVTGGKPDYGVMGAGSN